MPFDWHRGVLPCFAHMPSFSPYEAAFLPVLCFDIAPSLRDEVTLAGRVCLSPRLHEGSSYTFLVFGWCLLDGVTLAGRVFLRPRLEQRLLRPFLRVLVPSLRDGVTLPGRVCLSPRSGRRLLLHLPSFGWSLRMRSP